MTLSKQHAVQRRVPGAVRWVALLGMALLCWGLGPATASAQQRVGFVNPQRLIDESNIGRTAQQDLAKLGKEKDRQIRESAKAINELKSRLADATLSDSEQRTLESKLQILYEQHDRLIQKSNEDIQFEEARLIQFIMKRADTSLREIANENGFAMVLTDPKIIGYIDDSADLTDLVIQDLNQRY
ncbi:MAG: OmpH family outer membrane protein [Desulfovibrio sp.]|nr:OmpH family outer membrane protein [Desulfovibrio sp.]